MQTAIGDPMQTVVEPRRLAPAQRLWCALIGACCLGVLGVAAWLTPSASGVGTHTQLGMPQCRWVAAAQIPCPTCGMTTAFAYAVHLHPWQSLKAQPMGFFLAVVTGIAFWASMHSALTGSRVAPTMLTLWQPRLIWIVGAFALGAWGYKIWAYRQGIVP